MRAFEFQGSRQIRAQRRRELRELRGRSMDSLPGEDLTLPLAFEGRYRGSCEAGIHSGSAGACGGAGPAGRGRGSGGRAPGLFCSQRSPPSSPTSAAFSCRTSPTRTPSPARSADKVRLDRGRSPHTPASARCFALVSKPAGKASNLRQKGQKKTFK